MAFKDLISDLRAVAEGQGTTLAKSQGAEGADDANIQAAGATGGDSGTGGEGAAAAAAAEAGAGGEGGGEGGEGTGSEGGDADVVKSFEVQLENGEKFQAIDASELLKSLQGRLGDVETSTGEALGLCVDLIKAQAGQIAELTASVKKLAGAGTGRQAVLAIVPRPDATATGGGASGSGTRTLAKSEPASISPQEFLLKAESAFNAEKLSGRDLALVESHINRGEQMPAALIQKVMAGQPVAAA